MHTRSGSSLVLGGLVVTLISASGPQASAKSKSNGLESVRIDGVPHVTQRPDFCGEACVSMWLAKLGKPGDQDWVFEQSELDPSLGRGDYAPDLARALKNIGFHTGAGWYSVPADDDDVLETQFEALHADLMQGIPSIVCMHFGPEENSSEHFRLVLGYDAKTDEVLFHDPAEANGAYRRMARKRFLALWPLKYARDRWTLVRFRLEDTGQVQGGTRASSPGPADFAQHVMALKEKLPENFAVEISAPFVVTGDIGSQELHRWATGTVAWAVEKLKQDYFENDPDEILDIYLFRDAKSYQRYTRELFGDTPDTPYGYFSPAHRALIMNIGTGGGTLVHEIVHPFVRANFPDAPAWLNEGLGSLYEQSAERSGHIVGLTNWRLAGLQEAVRNRELPRFEALFAQSDSQFYNGATSNTNYGQSRYLLYYLQERGLLTDFYERFHDARKTDPTGYRTLQSVLKEKDMDAFQQRWEKWVLGLEFKG
jgi:hypothetical protein